jgi:hypothetical protein
MATEDVRAGLRRRLAEEYGMDEADLLVDRPPGGWGELVTKEWLHLELGALEARVDAMDRRLDAMDNRLDGSVRRLELRLDRIETRLDGIASELRSQTWRLVTVLVAGMGIAIGASRF